MELTDDLKNEVSLSTSQALTVTPGDQGGGGGAGGSGGLKDWEIALSVLLPVLLVASLAALIVGLCYHRRRRNSESRPASRETSESQYQVKSHLPYTDIDFTPQPPTSSNSVVILTEETDSEEDVARVFSEEGDQASLASLSSLVTQSRPRRCVKRLFMTVIPPTIFGSLFLSSQ